MSLSRLVTQLNRRRRLLLMVIFVWKKWTASHDIQKSSIQTSDGNFLFRVLYHRSCNNWNSFTSKLRVRCAFRHVYSDGWNRRAQTKVVVTLDETMAKSFNVKDLERFLGRSNTVVRGFCGVFTRPKHPCRFMAFVCFNNADPRPIVPQWRQKAPLEIEFSLIFLCSSELRKNFFLNLQIYQLCGF